MRDIVIALPVLLVISAVCPLIVAFIVVRNMKSEVAVNVTVAVYATPPRNVVCAGVHVTAPAVKLAGDVTIVAEVFGATPVTGVVTVIAATVKLLIIVALAESLLNDEDVAATRTSYVPAARPVTVLELIGSQVPLVLNLYSTPLATPVIVPSLFVSDASVVPGFGTAGRAGIGRFCGLLSWLLPVAVFIIVTVVPIHAGLIAIVPAVSAAIAAPFIVYAAFATRPVSLSVVKLITALEVGSETAKRSAPTLYITLDVPLSRTKTFLQKFIVPFNV